MSHMEDLIERFLSFVIVTENSHEVLHLMLFLYAFCLLLETLQL